MMTTARDDLSAIEQRIKSGDRDAMASYLAVAIRGGSTKAELKRRYDFVWDADHGNDSMVLRNLSIIAAAGGQFEKTRAFAKDFMTSSFFADAFHSALALRKYGGIEQCTAANDIIRSLAERGHVRSQLELKSQWAKQHGLFGTLVFRIFRLWKISIAFILLLKNRSDPRISN